jgi:hypothetical protein
LTLPRATLTNAREATPTINAMAKAWSDAKVALANAVSAPAPPPFTSRSSCDAGKPHQKVVWIKTHKTGA